jgi:hypothetical protein
MTTDLKRSDLNLTTATHYDWLVAAPSDDMRIKAWYIFSISAAFVTLTCLVLIVTIVASPRLRSRSFNIHILFLTIPDTIFSFLCTITCFLNINVGKFHSKFGCEFQSWYCSFSWSASMWMNFLIAHELLFLLKKVESGDRLKHSPKRTLYIRIFCVYAYSAFVSSWTLIDIFPHRAQPVSGLACLPVEYDRKSSFFFWLGYIPAILGIPLAYIVGIIIIVQKRDLLPSQGNCRYLAVFFVRLLTVFIVMWLPAIILIFVVPQISVWAPILGGTWSHLQGLFSALMCLNKPDIKETLFKAFPCKCRDNKTSTRSDHVAEYDDPLSKLTGNVSRKLPFRSFYDSDTNNFIPENSINSVSTHEDI